MKNWTEPPHGSRDDRTRLKPVCTEASPQPIQPVLEAANVERRHCETHRQFEYDCIARAAGSARSHFHDVQCSTARIKATRGTRHLARDALSWPVASTPSLGYPGLIARTAPPMLSLALRLWRPYPGAHFLKKWSGNGRSQNTSATPFGSTAGLAGTCKDRY